MKQGVKRLLAWLMTLSMVFSLWPTTVFAETVIDEGIPAVVEETEMQTITDETDISSEVETETSGELSDDQSESELMTEDSAVEIPAQSVVLTSEKLDTGASVTFQASEGTEGVGSENYGRLIDGDTSTKWCVTSFASAYIIFEASASIRVNGYTITTGNDNSEYSGRNPASWTLYGRNEGTDWQIIDARTNDTTLQDKNYQDYDFSCTSTDFYKYFKLEITATRGSDVMQMSEFTLKYSMTDICSEHPSWSNGACTVCGTIHTQHSDSNLDYYCDTCGLYLIAYENTSQVSFEIVHADGNNPLCLIDGLTDTGWFAMYNGIEYPYIIIKSSEPILVSSYSLKQAGTLDGAAPSSWTLSASTDGKYFEQILDSQYDSDVLYNNATFTNSVSCSEHYSYFKLEISENVNYTFVLGVESVELGEISFEYTINTSTSTEEHEHVWVDGECTICHGTHIWHTDSDNDKYCDICGIYIEDSTEETDRTEENPNGVTFSLVSSSMSIYGADEDPSYLFDSNLLRGWNAYDSNTSDDDYPYVIFKASESISVNGYTISVPQFWSMASPAEWILLGSNDGVSWETIDTREGVEELQSHSSYSFSVTNNNFYEYFKLEVRKSYGTFHYGSTDTNIWISELELKYWTYEDYESTNVTFTVESTTDFSGKDTAAYLFDGSADNSFYGHISLIYLSPCVIFKASQPICVNGFTMSMPCASNEKAPLSWRLWASNDPDGDWTEIYYMSASTALHDLGTYSSEVDSSAYYSYFMLEIIRTYGSGGYWDTSWDFELGELALSYKTLYRCKQHTDSDNDKYCDVCGTALEYTITVTSRVDGSSDSTTVANLTGGGVYNVDANGGAAEVTVTAPAKDGFNFKGWYIANEYGDYDGDPVCRTLSYTFVPTESISLVAVYATNETKIQLTVDGNGFSVNGYEQAGGYAQALSSGSKMTLTYTGENEFLGWKTDNDKIVSTSKTYTFTLVSATKLTPYTVSQIDGAALVIFQSEFGQVISAETKYTDDVVTLPEYGPSKPGYVFVGWSMTAEEIKAAIKGGATNIIVTPVYEENERTHTVKVIYPDEEITYDVSEGTMYTVTAKDMNGLKFKCWSRTGWDYVENILGYSESYKVLVLDDVTLYAVYVSDKDADEVVQQPTIVLSNTYSTISNGLPRVGFSFTRDVPEGYTLVETGVLFNNTGALTVGNADDALVLDGELASKGTAKNPAAQGVYTAQITYWGPQIFARGYMIVTDESTNEQITLYTPICYGDYIQSID